MSEKTLQDFADKVAQERGYSSFNPMVSRLSCGINIVTEAAERYATFREEQATSKAFEKGRKSLKEITTDLANSLACLISILGKKNRTLAQQEDYEDAIEALNKYIIRQKLSIT